MNKFLFFLAFVLISFSVHAQSQDPGEDIQKLVYKVDSLEHELSYLKLTYELSVLNSDMTMFTNGVNIKTIEIQLNLYNRIFNSQLGDMYQQYYEACQHRKQSISELIEVKKTFLGLKVLTYPYTENELNVLMQQHDQVNSAYETLERSMDLLKVTVDAYNESL